MIRWYLLFGLLASLPISGQTITLQGVDARLISCRPVSTVPCFRLKLMVADAQGKPASVNVPSQSELPGTLTVNVAGKSIRPFYAQAASADSRLTQKGRTALILVDVSGSMNTVLGQAKTLPKKQTRFDAAQAALREFLRAFQPGTDSVAIVPFESHDVLSRIRSAPFVHTEAEAEKVVAALPYPDRRNNTALFAAVDAGIDVLAQQKLIRPQDEQLLVVLTDGHNDVQPGDDPDLLQHPVQLEALGRRIRAFEGQTLAIGFGDPKDIDVHALGVISNRVKVTADASTLAGIFGSALQLLSSQLQLTFSSPYPDLASLAGRDLEMDVIWALPGGRTVRTEKPVQWQAGDMGVGYEGTCDQVEKAAVPKSWNGTSVWRPVIVFVVFACVLAVMWFWIPRFIWPSAKSANIQAVRGGRSANPQPSRGIPRPPVRNAADPTIVQKFSDTESRTRLDNK